jgi:hypothetical protein
MLEKYFMLAMFGVAFFYNIISWIRELSFYSANGWDFSVDLPGAQVMFGDPGVEKIPNKIRVFVYSPVVTCFSALGFFIMIYAVFFQSQ